MQKLTDEQYKKLKTLIKQHCANYIDNKCIVLNCQCPQLGLSETRKPTCRYLKDVLLYDPAFAELYSALRTPEKGEDKRHCAVCGNLFIGRGKQKYCCDDCRKKAMYKQQADYRRNKAKSV